MLQGNIQSRVTVISRSKGHSAVAAAAYQSGEELYDERHDVARDYTRKSDVIHSEILVPDDAPEWVNDRKLLWNEVERFESENNRRWETAQLARRVELALPRELDVETNKIMTQEFIEDQFVSKGMVADFAIHSHMASDGEPNIHVHIMLTMRDISEEGFGNKNRDWNGITGKYKHDDNVTTLRQAWANKINSYFEQAGIDDSVDPRSYKERGVDKIPQPKLGRARHMEEHGIITEQGEQWRAVEMENTVNAFEYMSAAEPTWHESEDLATVQRMRERANEWFKEADERVQQEKGLVQ